MSYYDQRTPSSLTQRTGHSSSSPDRQDIGFIGNHVPYSIRRPFMRGWRRIKKCYTNENQEELQPLLSERRDELYYQVSNNKRDACRKAHRSIEEYNLDGEDNRVVSLTDPRVVRKSGETVLYHALKHGSYEAARYFINNTEDIDLFLYVFGKERSQKTNLSIILQRGNLSLLEEFLTRLHRLIDDTRLHNYMRTPITNLDLPALHWVVDTKKTDVLTTDKKCQMIRILTKFDSDCVNYEATSGKSTLPLELAVTQNDSDHQTLTNALLEKGASPFKNNWKNKSALSHALELNRGEIVKDLLEKRTNTNDVSDVYDTQDKSTLNKLFVYAVEVRDIRLAETLLEENEKQTDKKVDFHAMNSDHKNIWNFAFEKSEILTDVLELYCKFGVSHSIERAQERQKFIWPLQECVRKGDKECLTKLLHAHTNAFAVSTSLTIQY